MSAVAKLERWKVVHEALIDVAVRRAALDADEMKWLYEAEQLQIWKQVGVVSMVDYLERVLGHAPRTAQERMRVARALADLPALMEALAIGELPFSAVKELVRIATRSTEQTWCEAARGKNLREIEQLVAGRKRGDLPTDLPDEEARLHALRFDEISASTYALFRQARQAIDRENGSRVTDDQLVRTIALAILDGAGHSAAKPVDHGRARNQIHYTVCQHCERAWQDGGGERIRIEAATLAQARCDAVEIPRAIDGKPQRASQTIPPAIRREVFHRDENRCQTPGCRSTSNLEIHHIVARADGGTHDPSNLTLRCDGCHMARHEGRLVITGTAPDKLTTTRVHALSPSSRSARAHHRPSVEAIDHPSVETPDHAHRPSVEALDGAELPRAHVGVERIDHLHRPSERIDHPPLERRSDRPPTPPERRSDRQPTRPCGRRSRLGTRTLARTGSGAATRCASDDVTRTRSATVVTTRCCDHAHERDHRAHHVGLEARHRHHGRRRCTRPRGRRRAARSATARSVSPLSDTGWYLTRPREHPAARAAENRETAPPRAKRRSDPKQIFDLQP